MQRSPKRSQPNVSSNNQKLFTKILLGFLQQKSKNKLSLIPKTQSTDLNPNLLQSVIDLLSNLPKLSKKLNQLPLNITAQILPDLFIIPYGETSIVVAKQSNQLIPFPLLYRDGFYYCKLWNLTLKITYDGSNYVFELKNEDGSNVPINPKLIGYNSELKKSKFTSNRKFISEKNNKEEAVEISKNILSSSQISQSAPKIELINTLQRISSQQKTQSRSIMPSLQKQLKNIRSQIPENPQASLQNTELIAKINDKIMITRQLNRYYVIFEHNGRHYEHELTKENNLLYCKNCSIQIQGKEQLFNFSYDMDKKEHKFEHIIQKRISNNRVNEVIEFTEKLVELQNEPVQKGNKSLQLILYSKQQPFQFKINERLVESILSQNKDYGVLQDFPETSLQIAKNIFIVPFPPHETNYLVVPQTNEETQIFPFQKDPNTGEIYCEFTFGDEIYTIIYRGKNNNGIILFDAKNRNGKYITMNRKRIGYNVDKPNNSKIILSNIKPIKHLNWEDCWKDNKIQITDNLYIEQNDDKYFLRGQILSSTGARAITLNEPMQKNGNILSTFLNGKQIKYDIDRCTEPNYNPFKTKNNKINKNNQVNNELSKFLDLLNRETDILNDIDQNNTNINLLQAFIINFDNSYKKLNKNNKIKYEDQYTTFKSKIIEKIDIVIQKNQIKQQASNDSSLPIWTHQKSPTKTKLNKFINGLSSLKDSLKESLLKRFRSPSNYSRF